MKSKRLPAVMGICMLLTGVVSRVTAYQFVREHGTPEWVYDLDAVGNSLCSSFTFLLLITVCRYLPHIKLFHFAKAVSVVHLLFVVFDAAKEVVGLNKDNSWHQVAFFCAMLSLILFYQYHVYKRDTSPD